MVNEYLFVNVWNKSLELTNFMEFLAKEISKKRSFLYVTSCNL